MANSFTVIIPREQLVAKAKQANIDPVATSGTLPEVDGVQLSYSVVNVEQHSPLPAELMTIEFYVVKKPFYVSVGVIKDHVANMLGVPR